MFVLERKDLEDRVAAHLTERQIAEQLGTTKACVHYWLGVHGLKTHHPAKRNSSAEAKAGRLTGQTEILSNCHRHGRGRFVLESSGYYRCARCRSERVADRRRALKSALVSEFGGECVLCGYSRSERALEFHHLDPDQKQFGIGMRGITRSLEALRAEAAKCVLLCANCHAEVESGFVQLPSRLRAVARSPDSAALNAEVVPDDGE